MQVCACGGFGDGPAWAELLLREARCNHMRDAGGRHALAHHGRNFLGHHGRKVVAQFLLSCLKALLKLCGVCVCESSVPTDYRHPIWRGFQRCSIKIRTVGRIGEAASRCHDYGLVGAANGRRPRCRWYSRHLDSDGRSSGGAARHPRCSLLPVTVGGRNGGEVDLPRCKERGKPPPCVTLITPW